MRILILSDPHYAGPAERRRVGHEASAIGNPALRTLARAYRRFIWLADPYNQNHLLDRALTRAPDCDLLVANGDYTLDTRFVGISDDAALESAELCLATLRTAYGGRTLAILGDHELGKMSLFGGVGGPRLESWRRAESRLGLAPFWHREWEHFDLVGVTSSLLALPLMAPELLDEERDEWTRLRDAHLNQVRAWFDAASPRRRILLFCHDPSALPFIHEEEAVRRRLGQVAATVVGHLHSPAVFRASSVLAGMPPIGFMGNTVRRLSTALARASCWRDFKAVLCPALSGMELFKDGGFLTLDLARIGGGPLHFERHSTT